MKKTVGLMALLISAATALVPAAMARDWDDRYENRDRGQYTYQVETRGNEGYGRRVVQDRNWRMQDRYNSRYTDRSNYGRSDYSRSNYSRSNNYRNDDRR